MKNLWNSLNLPNKLTVVRILLVLPFILLCSITVVLWNYRYENPQTYTIGIRSIFPFVILIFIVGMVTDYFDGKLARQWNQITSFGKLFDPIADKFLTTSALIFLSVLNMIPVWLTLLFILRDLLVDASRILMSKYSIEIAASKIGKIKTMLLSIGLVITMVVFVIWAPNAPFSTTGGQTTYYGANYYWLVYIINLPIFVACLFNIISGVQYVRIIFPIIRK